MTKAKGEEKKMRLKNLQRTVNKLVQSGYGDVDVQIQHKVGPSDEHKDGHIEHVELGFSHIANRIVICPAKDLKENRLNTN